MFDIKSAKITGAKSAGRARVIWRDGELLAFDHNGLLFSVESEKPTRRPKYIRAWDAVTPIGTIKIDETCWTCGGWLKMAMKSINELMGGEK